MERGALKHPIRLVLFQALIVELKARVLKLDTCQESHRDALRLSIITETGSFPYQIWNRAAQAPETITDKAPLTAKEVIQMLDELMVLSIQDGVMPRFHPTKGLTAQMEGPSSDLDDRARASQPESLSGVGALGMPVRQRSDEASGSVIETRAARTLCGSPSGSCSFAGKPFC